MENYAELKEKLLNLKPENLKSNKKINRRTFNLDDDVYRLLGIYADKKGISRSKALNEILEEYFNSLFKDS